MARHVAEVVYGEITFQIHQPGAVDGMAVLRIVSKSALPAVADVARNATGLRSLLSGDGRAALLQALGRGEPVEEAQKGQESREDQILPAVAPMLDGLARLMGSLSDAEMEELLERLLFRGGIVRVMRPDPKGGRMADNLNKALFDDLFTGDALGGMYLLGRAIWNALGNRSPAIDAVLRRASAGGAGSKSGTSTTSKGGSTDSSTAA